MKKTLSILLVFLLVLQMAVPAYAAQGDNNLFTVTANTASAQVGDTVYVTVSADSAYENMSTVSMKVYYDAAAFELDADATTISTGNHFFEIGNPQQDADGNYVTLSFMDFNANTNVAIGEYATLAFRAIAASDAARFWLSKIKLADDTLMQVTYEVKASDPAVVTVNEAPAYTGYAVSAPEDKTITAGETAEVQVTVSSEENPSYNAYDLTLTYDTDKLTYVSGAAADADASVTESNGTIRVKGYGDDKDVDTAAVTLTFTAKATGDANVTITSAKVDIGNHAIDNDAPDATILDDTTVITISGYPVTLGEGLTGDSVAAPNEPYTFTATEAANYDYTITATMGGEAVTPTDNGDGTYTIANVTGNLVISAVMTPKIYTVTVEGTGEDDVTAASTATYNTAYTFTVTEDPGYTYTVSVTVGGESYTLGAPENGAYTIPGTDVTGDIVITVNKTVKPAETVNVTKPDYVEGADTATKGEDYTFSIKEEEGYVYGEPTVAVGGEDITEQIVKNEDGSYTIPGEYVTGDITIEVEKTAAVTVDVAQYITLDEQSMFLVTASGTFAEGSIAKYDGMSMFWSEKYGAYAWLVVSAGTLDDVKAEAAEKVTVAEGTAAGTVDNSGDVNGTNLIDVNDAQLTYDMYNAKYDDFDTVSMLKFLNADVNGDKTVNVADAAAIVAAIQ